MLSFRYLIIVIAFFGGAISGCNPVTRAILSNSVNKEQGLCDSTYEKIFDRLQAGAHFKDLPPSQQMVLLVWDATTAIEGEGFEDLFVEGYEDIVTKGDSGLKLTLQGFKTIGCDSAAAIIQEAIGKFPGGTWPPDPEKREELYVAVSEEERDKLNDRFSALGSNGSNEIAKKMAKFIQDHASDFR